MHLTSKMALIMSLAGLSTLASARESGYQQITRLQTWATVVDATRPSINIMLANNHHCGGPNPNNVYTMVYEQAITPRGQNALSVALAAKMAGKPLNISFECLPGTPYASIHAVDIQ